MLSTLFLAFKGERDQTKDGARLLPSLILVFIFVLFFSVHLAISMLRPMQELSYPTEHYTISQKQSIGIYKLHKNCLSADLWTLKIIHVWSGALYIIS